MKRILNKMLTVILIMLILNNFLMSSFTPVYAAESGSAASVEQILTDILGSVVGIFTYIPKVAAVGLAFAIENLLGGLAYSQGKVDSSGNIQSDQKEIVAQITPFDIFFNKMALTDINFFKMPSSNESVIYKIRSSIANWYYVMRTLAASILLVILIYIGIRMAISTVASERAMYKKMLVDWTCSLVLIFLLHYIALFVITLNDAFIKILEGVAGEDSANNMKEVIQKIRGMALGGISINSLAAAVVYVMIVIQTFALLISYFTRMLKLAFLLIIAPLITLTYSIDKIGDGKAQALGNWLKEFVYTVLIQPFHCIIYLAFISMAFNIIVETGANEQNNLAAGLMGILCLRFTKEAENIIRKIFGFKDDNKGTSIAGGMAMSAMALGAAQKIGKGTRVAVNQIGNFRDRTAGVRRSQLASAMATRSLIASKMSGEDTKNDDGSEKTFADRRQEALDALDTKAAAKRLEKDNKKYGVKSSSADVDKKFDEIKAAAEANGQKLTNGQMMARARLSVAQENRNKLTQGGKTPQLKGFRGTIVKAKNFMRTSATAKAVKDLAQKSIAGGAAIFTGAALYGTGSNLASSITGGMAIKKGASEFMKNSGATIANDINDRMQSLGIKTGIEAEDKINDIVLNGNAGEYDDKKLKAILGQVEKALIQAGMNKDDAKNVRYSMQNTINQDLARNPSKDLDSVVQNAMRQAPQVAALDAAGQANVRNELGQYATAKQEAAVYQAISTGTDIGIDPNRMAEMAASSYIYNQGYADGGDSDNSNQNGGSQPGGSQPGQPQPGGNNEVPPEAEETRNETERTREELEQMQEEIEEQKRQIEQQREELEERKRQLEEDSSMNEEQKQKQEQLIDAMVTQINNQIESINRRIDQIQEEMRMNEYSESGESETNPIREEGGPDEGDMPDPIDPIDPEDE